MQPAGQQVLTEVPAGEIKAALSVVGFLASSVTGAVGQCGGSADRCQAASKIMERDDRGVLHLALRTPMITQRLADSR